MAIHLSLSLLLFFISPSLAYTPPAPPPAPTPPPHPSSLSCSDLNGVGSLNTTCQLSYTTTITSNVYIYGTGNIEILQGVALICPNPSCSLQINVSGHVTLSSFSQIVAGSVVIHSGNITLHENSYINVTGRGGEPDEHSTGRPDRADGGGGGYGGRGASCVMDNKKLPEDVWGGDGYGWEEVESPWSFGSRGGTTSKGEDYGGMGGGRVWFVVKDLVELRGRVLASGGDGGIKGGGGSGGSVYVKSHKM